MATITASGTAVCELCEAQNLGQLCLNEQSTHQLVVAPGGTASQVGASGATATVGTGGFLTITPTATSGFVQYEVCTGAVSAASVVFVSESSADASGNITLPAATGSNCFHVMTISGSSDQGGGAAGTTLNGWTLQFEEFSPGAWQPHLAQLTQAASPTASVINVSNSMTAFDGAVVKTFCNVSSFSFIGSNSEWTGSVDAVSPTGTMPSGAVSVASLAIDANQTVSSPPPGYINLISDYATNGFGGVNVAHSASAVGGLWPDPDNNTNYAVGTLVLNPTSGTTQNCETCQVSFTAIDCTPVTECQPLVAQNWCIGQTVNLPLQPVGQTFTLLSGTPSGIFLTGSSGGTTISGSPTTAGSGTISYRTSAGTQTCQLQYTITDCSTGGGEAVATHFVI